MAINNTNPMTELKAKDCAFCNQHPVHLSNGNVGCKTITCPIIGIEFDPDQWNTRPRESRLEGALREARDCISGFVNRTQISMDLTWKLATRGSNLPCPDKLPEPVQEAKELLSSINAVLGKAGE